MSSQLSCFRWTHWYQLPASSSFLVFCSFLKNHHFSSALGEVGVYSSCKNSIYMSFLFIVSANMIHIQKCVMKKIYTHLKKLRPQEDILQAGMQQQRNNGLSRFVQIRNTCVHINGPARSCCSSRKQDATKLGKGRPERLRTLIVWFVNNAMQLKLKFSGRTSHWHCKKNTFSRRWKIEARKIMMGTHNLQSTNMLITKLNISQLYRWFQCTLISIIINDC